MPLTPRFKRPRSYGVLQRAVEVEHGREAHVAALQLRAPLLAGARAHDFGDPTLAFRPSRRVVLVGERRIGSETELLDQQRVETGLERREGDPVSVGAAI